MGEAHYWYRKAIRREPHCWKAHSNLLLTFMPGLLPG